MEDTKSSSDSSSTIEKEVEATVNYQITGRGLIYNCKGKHWACVDKANYMRCRSLAKSGSKDCVTRGDLKRQIAEMQRKYTTGNVKTDFV